MVTASCASDLNAVVDVVGRLRLDGRVMSKAEFEALVLHGEIAPPPLAPNWRDPTRSS